MALGTAETVKIYAWSAGAWVDISSYILEASIVETSNQGVSLNAQIVGLESLTEKAYVAANNKICIYIGTTLYSKLHCEQPVGDTNYESSLVAYSSSGSKATLRQLLRDTVSDSSYDDIAGSTIISSELGGIIDIDGSDSGGSTKLRVTLNNDNCVDFLNQFCRSTNQEWWISYPSLADAVLGTDTLHIASNKGTIGSSQYTFSSASNSGKISSGSGTDLMINKAIVKGSGVDLGSSSTTSTRATTKRSTLNGNLDTWLDGGLDYDDLVTINVKDTTRFPSSGVVKIGNELISYSAKPSSTTLTIDVRGYDGTPKQSHKDGDDVINMGPGGDDTDVVVVSAAAIGAVTDFWIGSEKFTRGGTSTNTFTDCLRGQDGTPMYAHGTGVEVYSADDTEDSPGTDSSMKDYGRKAVVIQDNLAKTKNDLDLTAQKITTDRNAEYGIRNIEVVEPFDVFDTNSVVLGDLVTVVDDATGLSDDYRIMKISMKIVGGQATCMLEVDNTPPDMLYDIRNRGLVDGGHPNTNVGNAFDQAISLGDNNFLIKEHLFMGQWGISGSKQIVFTGIDDYTSSMGLYDSGDLYFEIRTAISSITTPTFSKAVNFKLTTSGQTLFINNGTGDAQDFVFYANGVGNEVLRYDHSANLWNFKKNMSLDDGSGDSPELYFYDESDDQALLRMDEGDTAFWIWSDCGMRIECQDLMLFQCGTGASDGILFEETDGTDIMEYTPGDATLTFTASIVSKSNFQAYYGAGEYLDIYATGSANIIVATGNELLLSAQGNDIHIASGDNLIGEGTNYLGDSSNYWERAYVTTYYSGGSSGITDVIDIYEVDYIDFTGEVIYWLLHRITVKGGIITAYSLS